MKPISPLVMLSEGEASFSRRCVKDPSAAPQDDRIKGHEQWSAATRPKGPRRSCGVSQGRGRARPAFEGQ
jgi:hypothetical protein